MTEFAPRQGAGCHGCGSCRCAATLEGLVLRLEEAVAQLTSLHESRVKEGKTLDKIMERYDRQDAIHAAYMKLAWDNRLSATGEPL
jgi:hypothetical protein